MLPLLTAAEMRALEGAAMSRGVPGRVLMENAATFALSVLKKASPAFVPVFCGKGNNAGDGFALARRLFVCGIKTEIVLCAGENFKGDAAENFLAAKAFGVPVCTFSEFTQKAVLPAGTYIVDALLGTGLSGQVRSPFSEAIGYLNESGFPILALDIPSGISADTGAVLGCGVHAAKTVTFGCRKLGLFSPLSMEYVGKVLCDTISLPHPEDCNRFLLTRQDVLLPPLPKNAHKGIRGHAVVMGGSEGMAGAVTLATRGAELSGAGLVTAMVPPALMPIMMRKLTGAMCASAESELPEKTNVLLAGPGLSRDAEGYAIFGKAISQAVDTVILDAGALYHLAKDLSVLKGAAANRIVLTPHLGEMSRLTGLSTAEIAENRVEIAEEFAARHKVTLVLKGAYTVVADEKDKTYINTTGNAGMAKGGSGDLLAGILLGLAAQGIGTKEGVYLHGLAGDLAARELGMRAMCAAQIEKFLPCAIKCMETGDFVQNTTKAYLPR